MKVRIMLMLLFASWSVAAEDEPQEEPPDHAAIERRCTEMLANVAPAQTTVNEGMTTMQFPDGRVCWGPLFSKGEIVALVSFHRPIEEGFDYPPHWLSLLSWNEGRWSYRQLLGSAKKFDIFRRKDLGLQIVQGYCQTERHGGRQSSWRYDGKSKRLVPTNLDDWGPYALMDGYICYQRGSERLAHWNTRWIYPFHNGRRGGLLACFHQSDNGRFAVTFKDHDSGENQHWAFDPDQNDESHVTVRMAHDEEDLDGAPFAELRLSKDDFLDPSDCFELLTGLSRKLLEDEWLETVPKPKVKRVKIEATGDPAVVRKFQWPNAPMKVSK